VLLQAWVKDGTPEGDPAEKPSHLIRSGWQLGERDLIDLVWKCCAVIRSSVGFVHEVQRIPRRRLYIQVILQLVKTSKILFRIQQKVPSEWRVYESLSYVNRAHIFFQKR
jgi:hypothetical protein